ncbi:peptide ABC transporter substrate-binding protein [Paenibacillus apiarius]|uniref:Peptide ABC transporter substrate-binding protein n=1 Tax=Paenibacillus apiarius TaxID=46240 RepID=A0ABT4DXY8_9BACL|nr:peptide ABC transporter substrate-binding protein [Paenibacillus apiarius]MCY9517505.1 peptide ABC transporter substrate-binding protein [Paenibacillus apiarius]MCY9522216.1 peptide ABC transporter substrate-binding protein [Paenibacillus apiarius]MCY9552250.1 peptide ABC transporter substrate-binding protein [Paenibacillus apiarius]MCY9560129.1 peptide ABC transporter substrate-binding protein [Paenibacillus apiarius]MCY9683747.1 peptide ABC transporter substrate-binding protein [Paenibaci
MRKWNVMLAILLFAAAALAGCASKDNNAANPSGAAQGAAENAAEQIPQVLTTNLSGGEPYTLDPAFASDTTSYFIIDNLYEGLYTYDKSGKIVEGAASKVDVSADAKTYTFTIRDGAKWSNGDPVTAQDFEYSWKRVLNPKTAAYDPSSLYYIKGAEEYNTGKGSAEDVGVTAKDDHTLVVELKAPLSIFPIIAVGHAYLPVRSTVVDKDEKWAAESNTIVGNGPYVPQEWKHNEQITLAKNDHYWNKDAISMETIHFKMVQDATTYYQMYKTGDLDMILSLPLDTIDQEKENKEYLSHPSFSVYTYSFNVKEKPFTNQKIRQAFSYAIDRESLTKNVTKGGETPATGYVPYGLTNPSGKDFRDDAPEKYYEFNAQKAKELLAEGLKEEGLTQLPPVTFKYNTADNHKKVAEALQEMLKENLGVEIKLENQEWKTYIDTFKQKNFQAARMGWEGNYLDPLGVLGHYTSSNSNNFTNWSNKEYDNLIEKSTYELDPNKRVELLQQAEKVLMEDLPIIPILFSADTALVSPKVTGIIFDARSNPDLRFATRIEQ